MQVAFSPDDLRPLIAQVVTEVISRIEADRAQLSGRLAFSEAEAAGMLGVPRHVLRDLRLRGEIHARKVGRGFRYSRDTLARFLAEGNR